MAYGGADDFVPLIATATLDADEWKHRSPSRYNPRDTTAVRSYWDAGWA